jgi:hypothetical protein
VGSQILPGQTLAATTAQGGLNQYYGYADTTSNVFASATQGNLCTAYTIPAGEANYAGAAYELSCAGTGQQGTTQQTLAFQMLIGSVLGTVPTLGAVVFSTSQFFTYSLTMRLTCSDGVSGWWADLQGAVVESTANLIPGTAGQQPVAIAASNSAVHAASVSSAITVCIQAKWGSTTGAPTMTNNKTTFRKVA